MNYSKIGIWAVVQVVAVIFSLLPIVLKIFSFSIIRKNSSIYLQILIWVVALSNLSLHYLFRLNSLEPASNLIGMSFILLTFLPFNWNYFVNVLRAVTNCIIYVSLINLIDAQVLKNSLNEYVNLIIIGIIFLLFINYFQNDKLFKDHIYSNYARFLMREISKNKAPHQLYQLSNGTTLDKTMPEHVAKAYICEVDAIGSSYIKLDSFDVAMKNFFRRYKEVLMSKYSYNSTCVYSEAYPLKQLGDGMLWASGYPFPISKESQKCSKTALRLAFEAFRIWDDEMRSVSISKTPKCAVCLVYTEIKGVWTPEPLADYDYEEKGIERVTRLSEFRRVLMKHLGYPDSNILIVDDEVFATLESSDKQQFEEVDLDSYGLSIRNRTGENLKVYYNLICEDKKVNLPPSHISA